MLISGMMWYVLSMQGGQVKRKKENTEEMLNLEMTLESDKARLVKEKFNTPIPLSIFLSTSSRSVL
jgi:hypothetical protein